MGNIYDDIAKNGGILNAIIKKDKWKMKGDNYLILECDDGYTFHLYSSFNGTFITLQNDDKEEVYFINNASTFCPTEKTMIKFFLDRGLYISLCANCAYRYTLCDCGNVNAIHTCSCDKERYDDRLLPKGYCSSKNRHLKNPIELKYNTYKRFRNLQRKYLYRKSPYAGLVIATTTWPTIIFDRAVYRIGFLYNGKICTSTEVITGGHVDESWKLEILRDYVYIMKPCDSLTRRSATIELREKLSTRGVIPKEVLTYFRKFMDIPDPCDDCGCILWNPRIDPSTQKSSNGVYYCDNHRYLR